jgi:hypothetical protein
VRPVERVLVPCSGVASLAESLTLGREVNIGHICIIDVRIIPRKETFQYPFIEIVIRLCSMVL